MKYRIPLLLLMLSIISATSIAQNKAILEQINQDVWVRFCHAFDSLDYTISEEIHTKDIMRISADQNMISDYKSYMENIQQSFNNSKERNESRNIELRFFERLADDSIASERGVYKFTLNKGTSKERDFYGQFHVLLVKREGIWKILMDYDSNENNTIDDSSFQAAFAMDDFKNFIEN